MATPTPIPLRDFPALLRPGQRVYVAGSSGEPTAYRVARGEEKRMNEHLPKRGQIHHGSIHRLDAVPEEFSMRWPLPRRRRAACISFSSRCRG